MKELKTSEEVEYDTKNAHAVLSTLEKSERGLTITDIANELKLNRHTVTKLLERMLIEKKANYDEKGPAKIFYSTGKNKFVGKLDQSHSEQIWVDVIKPRYAGEEEAIRINQTKHDHLVRSSSKFRSIGAVSIKKSQLDKLLKLLKDAVKKF
jgi:predicted ArsR family transcriptional regulator